MSKRDRIGVDFDGMITRDEALELMTHHLRLAAMFFEAVPKDDAANVKEIKRLLGNDESFILGPDTPSCVGALAFYERLRVYYEDLKEKD